MKVYFILIFQLLALSSGNDCPTYGYYNIPQFGDGCQYRCRCVNEEQCDRDTGACQNGCAPGWMGPGCQYRNLASINSGASQNIEPGTPASVAVDNNSTTCSNSITTEENETWWRVDLPKQYYFVGLMLKIVTETTVALRVEGSSDGFNTEMKLCYQHSDLVIPVEMEIMCLQPLYVQAIRIRSPKTSYMLQLCEVEIYGGRYVSYKGQTSMSTVFWGPSGNAVDGRPMLNGDSQEVDAERTCAVTHIYQNQYWQILFSEDLVIQGMYVYGRRLPDTPQVYGQSAGFIIHAMPRNGTYSHMYSDIPTGSSWADYQPRMVDLSRPRESEGVYIHHVVLNHLALCEVEVFAECERGRCGWNCSDVCHCAEVTTGLNRKNGTCPYGCLHRWRGQNGRCDNTCPDHTWGPDCALNCSNCAPGTQCHIDNGACPGGCDIGWKIPFCNTSCDSNMYGQNCSESCGQCRDNQQCNAFTGNCTGGCEPGWQGSHCQRECDDHFYGLACNKSCGHCFAAEPCNKENGTCASCDVGYRGAACNTGCEDTTYGFNCNETCGKCKHNEGCNSTTGYCPGECGPGWQGVLCKEPCDDNMYGLDCAESCEHCSEVCDNVDGHCDICDAGYKGALCTERCEDKTYGFSCNETCGKCKSDIGCNGTTGYCPGDCEPGWQGLLCKEPCDDHMYGAECNQSCGHCLRPEVCDNVDGHCDNCEAGYKGVLCNERCEDSTFGVNCNETCGKCNGNEGCNGTTGHCPGECEPGLEAPLCKEPCGDHMYGPECNQSCGHCLRPEVCDNVDGHCANCEAGYKGILCNETCTLGTYGSNCADICGRCKHNATCDTVNGTCHGGCEPGKQAPICKEDCADGLYGDGCNTSCGNCSTLACHKVTGHCDSCAAGYKGELCIQACDDYRYGLNCDHTCGNCTDNNSCDRVTGECIGGCISGYMEPLCKELLSSVPTPDTGSEGPPVGAIVGGIIAVLVVALVVLGVVLFIRRRSAKPTDPKFFFGPGATDNENGEHMSWEEPRTIEMTYSVVNHAHRVDDEKDTGTSDDYITMNEGRVSKVVPVSALKSYCQKIKLDPSQIFADFDQLPFGRNFDAEKAMKQSDVQKKELYPYVKNVADIPSMPGIADSDYISASYINGFDKEKRYIAAQGAMKNTVTDLWRMVWSHDIATIVMLTNCYELGKLKCEKYWPNEGSQQYGDITVKLLLEDVCSEHSMRSFELLKSETSEVKHTTQYHFTGWPDKDIPDEALSLVQFWRIIKQSEKAAQSPWMVHCSASIGRTGTFIALDYLYDEGKAKNCIDFKQCVHNLRDQWVNMVQTEDQYLFVHQAVQEAINPVGPAFHIDEFREKWQALTTKDDLEATEKLSQEFKAISDDATSADEENEYATCTYDSLFTKDDFSDSLKPENIAKSRRLDILPPNMYRPVLTVSDDNQNDYINAVFVSTFRMTNGLILNQLPLAHTVVDTLRLIWQFKISTVVVMEHDVPDDCQYWSDTPQKATSMGEFTVQLFSVDFKNGITTRKIMIKHQESAEAKEVNQLHYQKWPSSCKVPEDINSVISLVTDAEALMRKAENNGPLLVQCLDGATRSGLFSMLWSILERIKSDKTVAVADTVRLARVRRKEIIPDYEQYRFCWESVREYIDNANIYDNVM